MSDTRYEALIREGIALNARAENDYAGPDGVPRSSQYYVLQSRAEAKFEEARRIKAEAGS